MWQLQIKKRDIQSVGTNTHLKKLNLQLNCIWVFDLIPKRLILKINLKKTLTKWEIHHLHINHLNVALRVELLVMLKMWLVLFYNFCILFKLLL